MQEMQALKRELQEQLEGSEQRRAKDLIRHAKLQEEVQEQEKHSEFVAKELEQQKSSWQQRNEEQLQELQEVQNQVKKLKEMEAILFHYKQSLRCRLRNRMYTMHHRHWSLKWNAEKDFKTSKNMSTKHEGKELCPLRSDHPLNPHLVSLQLRLWTLEAQKEMRQLQDELQTQSIWGQDELWCISSHIVTVTFLQNLRFLELCILHWKNPGFWHMWLWHGKNKGFKQQKRLMKGKRWWRQLLHRNRLGEWLVSVTILEDICLPTLRKNWQMLQDIEL